MPSDRMWEKRLWGNFRGKKCGKRVHCYMENRLDYAENSSVNKIDNKKFPMC